MAPKNQILGIFLILGMAWLLACAPQATPAPSPQATAPAAAPAAALVTKAPATQAWEVEWDKTVEAAKQEGKVVIYTSVGGEVPRVMAKAFRSKYGITPEFVSGRGGQLATKILSERRAGLYLVDVYSSGTSSTILQLKPAGVFEDLRPALLLPEVTDPKVWYIGKLPWVDNEQKYILAFTAYPCAVLLINTDMAKPEEFMSYRDLLNPKWKGKIAMADPTVPGVGQVTLQGIFVIMGDDYVREMAKQEPNIIGEQRLVVEWVARSKYPLSLFPLSYVVEEFQKAGARIQAVVPKEGTVLTSGSAGLSLFKNAPHPNAAKVYINWLLTKEGQSIYAKIYNADSTRIDIDKEGIEPAYLRQPGVKYVDSATEDFITVGETRVKLMKEIFAKYLK